jgi:hypothetical protein
MTHKSIENKIIKAPPTPSHNHEHVLRIGVVPEHFSTPFHLGLDRNVFVDRDIPVDIIEYPRGTGSMCTALRDNHLDVAVALTEGNVKSNFLIMI